MLNFVTVHRLDEDLESSLTGLIIKAKRKHEYNICFVVVPGFLVILLSLYKIP